MRASPSFSFQWVNAVCSISPFLKFFYAFPPCSPPEPQTYPAECQQGNVTVVNFDALQPNYTVLFFKTLSIRLNEAHVSCLYLVCGDVLRRSCTFLTCLTCTFTHLVGSLGLYLNFCMNGNGWKNCLFHFKKNI